MVNKSKHIFYFDALRTVAILCVVLLHVTGHLGEIMNYNIATIFSLEGIYETWAISAFKIGVDLFLLLSGALLLGRDWQIKEFFQRRMPRIIKPFVFWVIITCLLLITASYFVGSINYVEHFDIISILTLFYDAFLFKAPGTFAFWFFWMMFGVYLVMPIFNKWILNSDLKEVEYFLVLWAIVTLFENTLLIDLPVNLSYFTSPIGLVILGYYLRYTERGIFKNKYLAIILIVVPT